MSVFVEAAVPVTIIFLTVGEKGRSVLTTHSAAEVGHLRGAEVQAATKFLGVSYVLLGFPDGELSLISQTSIINSLLVVLRRLAPAVIVSFHPNEFTMDVHHEDHRQTGAATSVASTLLDVSAYQTFDESGSQVEWNPELQRAGVWFWYTRMLLGNDAQLQKKTDTIVFEQSKKDKKRQVKYLQQHHASQAPLDSKNAWKQTLRRVAYNPKKDRYQENYLVVRKG